MCSFVVTKLMKPQVIDPNDYQKDFILRVDTDVATAFADVLSKVVELSPEAFAACQSLETIMKFLCDGLSFVQ